MNFLDIYAQSKEAFITTLKAMWCSSANNKSQQAYAEQIKGILGEIFAPKDAMPLVQCMNSYRSIDSSKLNEANELISGLWDKSYLPYEHQYKCWKHLTEYTESGSVKSIVVTTGTGSGKTECFMLPLISELITKEKYNKLSNEDCSDPNPNPNSSGIQAVFLYPLNALMEDQKARLQEYLKDTNLKFAVYNGNLPETNNSSDYSLSERLSKERELYPNILATREEMRRTPPNILLTNPTMLEYMLLRDKDQCLFDVPQSLKWVVIDETHTYSGAAAAELAMLMRRVMHAFEVNPNQVRFATSSATIGNVNNNQSGDNETTKLKQFIAGISGQNLNQIEIVGGERVDINSSHEVSSQIEPYRKKLFEHEYIALDQLIPGENLSIEDRLKELDRLCDLGLKAKVHFFNRVLNQGLKVKLTDHKDGSFHIYTTVPVVEDVEEPYLELMRCANCGEYVAVGESSTGNTFKSATFLDNDIFDFTEEEEEEQEGKKLIFSLQKGQPEKSKMKGNVVVEVKNNEYKNIPYHDDHWNITLNIQTQCPHCGVKLGKNTGDDLEEMNERTINPFRVSSDFVSRIISPVLLRNVSKASENDDRLPHNGQQYLSFVDSRQSAARATLKQNLEQEQYWVYSRIYHKLLSISGVKSQNSSIESCIESLKKSEKEYIEKEDIEGAYKCLQEIQKLETQLKSNFDKDYLSWKAIFKLLRDSSESNHFCMQFINRSRGSIELDSRGEVKSDIKAKYIYSVMIELLGRRPSKAKSPETMGLFTSYYPLLETKIQTLPKAVEEFNKIIDKKASRIDLADWKSLLHIFLDYNVRSNMSVFLRDPEFDEFDFKKDFQRFQTQKSPTRPVLVPIISSNSGVIVRMLANLLGTDFKQVIAVHKQVLKDVIDAMIDDLVRIDLLQKECKNHADSNIRLNLLNLGFKLYNRVCLCDTSRYESRGTMLRPVEVLFKGWSPYMKNNEIVKPQIKIEDWEAFPYVYGLKEGKSISKKDLEEWAQEKRKILCDNALWGSDGCFSDRLEKIHMYPKIFIQAEHTAQIDKLIAKQSQDMFRDRQLNILACSTTMEMGIDLGDLELVLLCSVPPHPANYKQRAGRSGRNLEAVRSTCITLCNSDSIGLRVLKDPLSNLIQRPTAIPVVDLNSKQVIQRHVNSFLLRTSNLFFNTTANSNNLDQKVISFFTSYSFGIDPRNNKINYTDIRDINNNDIYPHNGLGEKKNTRYSEFKNWINNRKFEYDQLSLLLRGTCFDGRIDDVVELTISEIDRCYQELTERIEDIKFAFDAIYKRERIDKKGKEKSKKETYDALNSGMKTEAKYARYLKHKFIEILAEGLLSYFATHRFTPNANMPVNIIEFDINFNNMAHRNWTYNNSSNPSYVLQEAISQYAPGNTIILSNRARVVRGVLYTGAFQEVNTFKKVYTDGNKVTIDKKLDKSKRWTNVSNRDYLELIQPYAFIPDINEPDSRKLEKNTYTSVDAQLINATDWLSSENNLHLVSTRTSDDSGDSSILYYNVGRGYGYCLCSKCGKTVLEYGPQNDEGYPSNIPKDLNNLKDSREENIFYHFNIKKDKLICSNTEEQEENKASIRRNVILGDRIQTDYCELKLRHERYGSWMKTDKDKKLVITLGIAFTRTLVEYLGIESRDISFIRMPNSHICIYDTNPGGSGYAKRLGDTNILNIVIDESLKLLSDLKSREELLDRYTLRYKEDLDIDAAIKWLEKEQECRKVLPDLVRSCYPNAQQASLSSLVNSCLQRRDNTSPILFTNDLWDQWCYKDEENKPDWHFRITQLKSEQCSLYIINKQKDRIPLPIINVLQQMQDWLKKIGTLENPLSAGLYPVAYVDGYLYFTTDVSTTNLNQYWAQDTLYSVQTAIDFTTTLEYLDLSVLANTNNIVKFTLSEPQDIKKTRTSKIASMVEVHCMELVKQFIQYTKSLPKEERVHVSYQDEHLKTGIGIVATLQFIKYFLEKIDRGYVLKFILEMYDFSYGSRERHFCHQLQQEDRDELLEKLVDEFEGIMQDEEYNLQGETTIKINEGKKLPHWRVLSFRCGRKVLSFYPNGGIINEWFFDSKPDKNSMEENLPTTYYTYENLSVTDDINIYRRKDIMYDVELVDIG